ncbi:hypothetical protein JW926_05630 [Candidatus Sumerlaeota bacterium]|nr:hypothetical protein [Candidatus Sumerlaeota bacterium]
MSSPKDIMDFCWVGRQLENFLGCLKEDPDLDPKDIATEKISKRHENLFQSYYLEEKRYDTAKDTIDRVREFMGRVAPRHFREPFLNALLEYEWLAHAKIKVAEESKPPKLYRDHILHPAAVCAIGWWMMNSGALPELELQKIAGNLRDKYDSVFPGMDWEDIAKRAWIIASLTHDLLYPVEFLLKLNDPIFDNPPIVSKSRIVLSHAEQIRNETTTKIFRRSVNKKILKETISGGRHIHSVLGALFLLDSHSDYKSTTLRRKIILELAASAIFFHHAHDKERICFKSNPLGCLLALADNCHEFGREYLIWSIYEKKRISEFIPPIPHSYIETRSPDDYCLHLAWNDPDKIEKLKKEENGFNPDVFIEDKVKFFELFQNPADNGFTFNMQID